MLKTLVVGYVVVALLMLSGLVYYAAAQGGGTIAWVLAAIWAVALVLIPAVALRALVR